MQQTTKILKKCSRCQSDHVYYNERMRTMEEIENDTYSGYFVHCCNCGLEAEEGNYEDAGRHWNEGNLNLKGGSVLLH